ncbi:hypothetical protein [Kyrpidia sp.]|uniref:hypothetical protein n=1 Tax=Kyrpidia sp. TaxID=2073077 RepID=UPI002586CF49|nr:hypothetical protein [Kyrpidia sp.]MCL6575551.1 hypothetical protein [Kyrpidia sp.]
MINEKELMKDLETIELEIGSVDTGWRKIRFVGKEVAGDSFTYIYLGRHGRILVCFDKATECYYELFDSFEDLKQTFDEHLKETGEYLFPVEIMVEAAEALGEEYVEKIEL